MKNKTKSKKLCHHYINDNKKQLASLCEAQLKIELSALSGDVPYGETAPLRTESRAEPMLIAESVKQRTESISEPVLIY